MCVYLSSSSTTTRRHCGRHMVYIKCVSLSRWPPFVSIFTFFSSIDSINEEFFFCLCWLLSVRLPTQKGKPIKTRSINIESANKSGLLLKLFYARKYSVRCGFHIEHEQHRIFAKHTSASCVCLFSPYQTSIVFFFEYFFPRILIIVLSIRLQTNDH